MKNANVRTANVSNTFQWLKEKGFMIMATKTTFQTLASAFYKAFEHKTRESGESFYALRDGSPEWMNDAICSAHDGRFPDDWTYDACHTIACSLKEYSDADAATKVSYELADECVDADHMARYKWLAMHPDNAAFCDEAEQELVGGMGGIADRIGYGQYLAAKRIVGALIYAIETQAGVVDADAREALEDAS